MTNDGSTKRGFRRRYSKYPSIGILDCLYEISFGSRGDISYDLLYSSSKKKIPGFPKQKFSAAVYRLKRDGYLEYTNEQDFCITKKGKEKINFAKIDNVKLTEKLAPDGLWRLIIFDIPETKRGTRDILRTKLNEFECYAVQKSVYAIPYLCEKEITEIASLLGITRYINIVLAQSLGRSESKIKKFFNL